MSMQPRRWLLDPGLISELADMYSPQPVKGPDTYTPKQIIHNPNAVIVFWKDGTKTIVRRREGDTDDIHSAFGQALAKKLFGGTTTVHKMVDRVLKDCRRREEMGIPVVPVSVNLSRNDFLQCDMV